MIFWIFIYTKTWRFLLFIARPAAPFPSQDSAQEAAAPTHLRPGRGVAEDRVQEEQVPRPGTAKLRDTQEDCGADTVTQVAISILSNGNQRQNFIYSIQKL